MGIRVVQRAFAPPSPHLYVPGGPVESNKKKSKQNIKTHLSSYKSSLLDLKCPSDKKGK